MTTYKAEEKCESREILILQHSSDFFAKMYIFEDLTDDTHSQDGCWLGVVSALSSRYLLILEDLLFSKA